MTGVGGGMNRMEFSTPYSANLSAYCGIILADRLGVERLQRGNRAMTHIFVGVAFVVIGGALLLNALDVIDILDDYGPWDLIASLIILSVVLIALNVLASRRFRRPTTPLTVIAIAAAIQYALLSDVDVWRYVVPAVVIVIGLAILLGSLAHSRRRRRDGGGTHGVSSVNTSGENDVNISVTMGNSEERNTSMDFRGGQISATMGEVKFDLSEAQVIEKPARIDVSVTMANVVIFVPSSWGVRQDASSTLGHGTTSDADAQDATGGPVSDGPPDLVISGKITMGHLAIERK